MQRSSLAFASLAMPSARSAALRRLSAGRMAVLVQRSAPAWATPLSQRATSSTSYIRRHSTAAAADSTQQMLAEARALLEGRGGEVSEADAARAVDMLRKCADVRGDPTALCVLGKIHELGLAGCAADARRALDLYRRAAAQGHPEAQYRAARLVFSGELEEAPAAAAAAGEEAAMGYARDEAGRVMLLPQEGGKCGDKPNEEEIARLLRPKRARPAAAAAGEGAAPQPSPLRLEAAAWLAASAAAGNADAAVLAGNLRVSGAGAPEVAADAAAGLALYEAAAARGHPDALFNLGRLLWEGGPAGLPPQDRRRALAHFQRAADEGDASSAFFLATLYHAGGPEGAPPRDLERALRFLDVAVGQEHAGALHYAALMHRTGEGVERNLPRMRRLLERAARGGSAAAAHCLADMHAAGSDGVERDRERAAALYRAAGDAGDADALCSLGALHMEAGEPARAYEAYKEAAAWVPPPTRACTPHGPQGHVAALRNLAQLFAAGAGVPRNEALSARLLAIAAGIEGPAPGPAAAPAPRP